MANFKKGEGSSLYGNDLIFRIDESKVVYSSVEPDKVIGQPIDVMISNAQVSAEDIAAGKGQSNPHFANRKSSYMDANKEKVYVNHNEYYQPSQVADIKATSGDNKVVKESYDGKKVTYYAAKGDAFITKDGRVLVNTKTLVPSENQLTPETLDQHYANTKAIKEVQTEMKNKEAEVAAPEVATKTESKKKTASKDAQMTANVAEASAVEASAAEKTSEAELT